MDETRQMVVDVAHKRLTDTHKTLLIKGVDCELIDGDMATVVTYYPVHDIELDDTDMMPPKTEHVEAQKYHFCGRKYYFAMTEEARKALGVPLIRDSEPWKLLSDEQGARAKDRHVIELVFNWFADLPWWKRLWIAVFHPFIVEIYNELH